MKKIKRVLLKLSGEALQSEKGGSPIDAHFLNRVASEVVDLLQHEISVAIVIGGGNFLRGTQLEASGMKRTTGDYMGMLATVMNALAFQDAIEAVGGQARVQSALHINQVCEGYAPRRAIRHLEKSRVVIFAAGTGNPFFTTDTAASLRAVEMGADCLIKATKVDGVYSADPLLHPDATRYDRISFDAVLQQGLAVMDTTAMTLCRENRMPIRVCSMLQSGILTDILVHGREAGTLVTN